MHHGRDDTHGGWHGPSLKSIHQDYLMQQSAPKVGPSPNLHQAVANGCPFIPGRRLLPARSRHPTSTAPSVVALTSLSSLPANALIVASGIPRRLLCRGPLAKNKTPTPRFGAEVERPPSFRRRCLGPFRSRRALDGTDAKPTNPPKRGPQRQRTSRVQERRADLRRG